MTLYWKLMRFILTHKTPEQKQAHEDFIKYLTVTFPDITNHI